MAATAYREMLNQLSVDDITKAYRSGKMSAEERDSLYVDKGQQALDALQGADKDILPYLSAVWKTSVKQIGEGWDNIKEAAAQQQGSGNQLGRPDIYAALRATWGAAQVLFTIAGSGISNLNNEIVNATALAHGASPGQAYWMGMAADLATGFLTQTVATRAVAKVATAGVAVTKADIAKEALADSKKMADEIKAMSAMAKGLEKDGITNAESFVKGAAEAAGQKVVAENIALEAPKIVAPAVTEGFAARLLKAGDRTFVLPKELQGAKPRYNYGSKEFTLEFDNLLDKTLYILAQTKPSRRDAEYMKTVSAYLEAIGKPMSNTEIRGLGQVVRDNIKTAAKLGEPGALRVPPVTDVTKLAQSAAGSPTFQEVATRIASGISEETARRELPALMKKFGISYADLKTIKSLRGDQPAPFTAQEFYGRLAALQPYVKEMSALARNAIRPNATLEEQTAFARYATGLLTGETDKITFNKVFMDMLLHWDPKAVASGDISGAMKTFATDIATMSNDNLIKQVFRSQEGYALLPSVAGAKSAFTNLLLPLSFTSAFIGNTLAAGQLVGERFMSNPEAAVYMSKGLMLATGDAFRTLGMQWSTRGMRGGQLGSGFGYETLTAVDNFFKVLMQRASIYSQAAFEGQRLGVADLGAHVAARAAAPSLAMLREAELVAKRATFQNDVWQWLAKAMPMLRQGPGTLWFPFMKSPVNIARWAWNRTPGLNLVGTQLYRDIATGGEAAERAIGQLSMSMLQGHFFWELAKDGYITGQGPLDPKVRGSWRATHEPNSLKTPDGSSTGLYAFGALGIQAMIIANIVEIADQVDNPTVEKMVLGAIIAGVGTAADQTAWRNFAGLVEGLNHGLRSGELNRPEMLQILSPLGGLLGGPIVSRGAQAMDPAQKDVRTWVDAVRSRVPGWSKSVPPLRDDYGDVFIPPTTAGSPWFGYMSPLYPKFKPEETNPLKLEGARLKASTPKFEDAVKAGDAPPPEEGQIMDFDIKQHRPGDPVAVPVTPQQRDRWKQIYGNIVKGNSTPENPGMQKGLLDTPEYQNAPDPQKRIQFEHWLSVAKTNAKNALLAEDKSLFERSVMTSAQRALEMAQGAADEAQQRQQIVDQVNEALDSYTQDNPEEKANLQRWGILLPDQPVFRSGIMMYGGGAYSNMDEKGDLTIYKEKQP